MKLRFFHHQRHAFTLIDLLAVLAVLVILLALVDFGSPVNAKIKAQRIACLSNLKEMGIAFKLWESDHGDQYPMSVAWTNGGAGEWLVPGKAYVWWQTVSNQLASPRALWCPADSKATAATGFSTGFGDTNISYFVNLDAAETYPQMIMAGDDHLLVNGKPVQPGVLNLRTNATIAWTQDRHHGCGNIGMADGSVQQITSAGLSSAVVSATAGAPTNTAGNRWLIP